MASIRRQATIQAGAAEVWDAVRDWGVLHERLVPGFAVDARVEGRTRVVTFFTGAVLRERILDVDDDERRLAWSIDGGPYVHHNASVVVSDAGEGTSRFDWRCDLLPDDAAPATAEMMERGTRAAKETLEALASRPAYVRGGDA